MLLTIALNSFFENIDLRRLPYKPIGGTNQNRFSYLSKRFFIDRIR